MARADPLAKYNAKRDFAKTAEPAGKVARAGGDTFMVQKHDATRLHWDLRLEVDGVLKSWAVTRGPSANPEDKRLAVRTEDHPLSYATFEGTIPKGEYGGGTVMLWDRGTWAPIAGKSAKDLEKGHLHFTVDGERMKGEWLLIRLKPRGKERAENWLLRKIDDDYAGGSDDLVERGLTSVKTGRTMDEIAAGKKAKELKSPRRRAAKAAPVLDKRARGGAPPKFKPPQLATLVDHVPPGKAWLHEVKFDGYRALVAVGGGRAKVYTRSGLDWSHKFPEIVEAAAALPVKSALIDGEIVAMDADGKPSFSALQVAIKDRGGRGVTMFAFDLLSLDGRDLTALPNIERKAHLRPIIPDSGLILYADHIVGEGEKLFETMCAGGYEGIVAKRADAPYRSQRTQAWLKVKCTRRQEFVVIGWSESEKASRGFRALLLGLNEGGALRYAGKVGTGFDTQTMLDLRARLDQLATDTPSTKVPREAARRAHWVRPELVAEVAFAEFTHDDVIRHASFLGLREDKAAKDVKPEVVAETPRAELVKISNRDRVIDEVGGVTKGELADYYERLGPLMLPVLGHRPVSLVRCPQGRAKHCFFQKHDAGSFGDLVKKVPVREKDGSTEDYLWLDSVTGILACVQMGTIEFHGWGSRVEDIEKPDRVIFDLDPDEGLDFADTKKAAFDLKGHLGDLGLVTFAMLSGGKGVHVVVPLTPKADWPTVKSFTERFARALEAAEPERFVANMSKAKRKGRIFVDYLRNQRGATAVLPYVARARPGTPVAAPITWEELRDIDKASKFTVRDAELLVERAESRALAGWGVADQPLPDL